MGVDLDRIAARLASVRERTLALVSTVDWAGLRRQHVEILSPIVWDLGHVGSFEEAWIGERLADVPPLADGYAEMFDPVQNPRQVRDELPLPDRRQLLEYLACVRSQTLATIADGPPSHGRLTRGGFVYEMIARHEEQHQETILQALQVMTDPTYIPFTRRPAPADPRADDEMVSVDAGPCVVGAVGGRFAYDNERPAHEIETDAFRIDRYPVTNGEYLEFVDDGGYRRPELWSDEGRRWLADSDDIRAPLNWIADDGSWRLRRLNLVEPLPTELPVCHVCYWEAEAYARWAGKRLPTEFEWERAALWEASTERSLYHPWGDEPPGPGRANLDQLSFGPHPIGAYPDGASPCGAEQMIGDVWEWTSSHFRPYPGFEAFPYPEYSEIHFGSDFRVLRGGSWATRPAVATGTFRNWDYPIRRQIFAGFRCAQDV